MVVSENESLIRFDYSHLQRTFSYLEMCLKLRRHGKTLVQVWSFILTGRRSFSFACELILEMIFCCVGASAQGLCSVMLFSTHLHHSAAAVTKDCLVCAQF